MTHNLCRMFQQHEWNERTRRSGLKSAPSDTVREIEFRVTLAKMPLLLLRGTITEPYAHQHHVRQTRSRNTKLIMLLRKLCFRGNWPLCSMSLSTPAIGECRFSDYLAGHHWMVGWCFLLRQSLASVKTETSSVSLIQGHLGSYKWIRSTEIVNEDSGSILRMCHRW